MSDDGGVKDTLAVGIAGEQTVTVTEAMKPGHLPVAVLSTPSMVQLIEMTCLTTAQPHLDDGEVTVGIHVCVSHTGAVMAGQDVVISCRLSEIDKRRLTFEVSVAGPNGVISEGTHRRAIVDSSRFG